MSEIEPAAATPAETPTSTPAATPAPHTAPDTTSSPPNRRPWWIAGAVALVAVLLAAAVVTTAAVAEDDDDGDDSVLVVDRRDLIGPDRAERLALEAVGAGTVTELHLDDEDGRLVYEAEVSDPDGPDDDVDVVIDARTGDVLTTDR